MERLTEWGESRQPEIKKGCGWDTTDKLYNYENTGLEPSEVWQLRTTFESIMKSAEMMEKILKDEKQNGAFEEFDRRHSGYVD